MTFTEEMLDAAKKVALTEARARVEDSKVKFFELFGSYVKPGDLTRVYDLWDRAVEAKAKTFLASTKDEADEAHDAYELCIDAVEELGLGFQIMGEAKVRVFAHDLMHEFIGGAFAVVGGVLQAALTVLVPGFGGIIGAAANIGLQKVVEHFNRSDGE